MTLTTSTTYTFVPNPQLPAGGLFPAFFGSFLQPDTLLLFPDIPYVMVVIACRAQLSIRAKLQLYPRLVIWIAPCTFIHNYLTSIYQL